MSSHKEHKGHNVWFYMANSVASVSFATVVR